MDSEELIVIVRNESWFPYNVFQLFYKLWPTDMVFYHLSVITCPVPTTSGVLQKQQCQNHFGGTCNFTCPYGYRMVGTATLNCLATNGGPPGVWDSPLAKCEGTNISTLAFKMNFNIQYYVMGSWMLLILLIKFVSTPLFLYWQY